MYFGHTATTWYVISKYTWICISDDELIFLIYNCVYLFGWFWLWWVFVARRAFQWLWQVVATLTLALRLSLAAASPIAESGFSGTWASVVVASVAVAAPRLQRTGSIGTVHGLFLHRVWDLPRLGIEPVSSACRWILYHRATREPPLCILIMHIQFGKPLTWGMHFENNKITHDKIGTPAPSADPVRKIIWSQPGLMWA